jgi:hypothetical protein
MKLDPAYATHLLVLIPLVLATEGDVLEMGMGYSSTIVLHELCRNRKLVSYENDPEVYAMFSKFKSENHELVLIDDWARAKIERPWAVALIDHKPAVRRRKDLIRLKGHADYIVVHDSERDADRFFRIRKRFSNFRYVHMYNSCKPETAVLSDKFKI